MDKQGVLLEFKTRPCCPRCQNKLTLVGDGSVAFCEKCQLNFDKEGKGPPDYKTDLLALLDELRKDVESGETNTLIIVRGHRTEGGRGVFRDVQYHVRGPVDQGDLCWALEKVKLSCLTEDD